MEVLSNKRLESSAIQRDFLGAHRLSLRQTFFGGGCCSSTFRTKDAFVSRIFIGCFIPSLYILLFLTNRYLPAALGHRFYGEERWEKTLLVGRLPKRKPCGRGWTAR